MTLPPANLPYHSELSAALRAAEQGRRVLLNYFGNLSQVEEKFQAGLVSEADRESEAVIAAELARAFPDYIFLGEESGLVNKKGGAHRGCWIVDPLDGTTNYVHQFPIFCISIGLEVDGELVVGVIDVPLLQQTFSATKGGGAYLNGKPIHVAQRSQESEFLLSTGFNTQKGDLASQVAVFADILQRVRGVRRPGAAAYDLCMVAQGVFDGFWEKNLAAWDMAAGALLVQEAGGVVSDWQGSKFDVYQDTVIAGSVAAHACVLGAMRGGREEGSTRGT